MSLLELIDVQKELISRLKTHRVHVLFYWTPIPFLVDFPNVFFYGPRMFRSLSLTRVVGLTFWNINCPVTYLVSFLRTES